MTSVLILLICETSVLAKSKTDWDAVREIERSRLIKVTVGHKIRCEFVEATDDKLFCDEPGKFLEPTNRFVIDRKDVREIRVALPNALNKDMNGAIGAAIGGLGSAAVQGPAHSGRFDPVMALVAGTIGVVWFGHKHFVWHLVYRV